MMRGGGRHCTRVIIGRQEERRHEVYSAVGYIPRLAHTHRHSRATPRSTPKIATSSPRFPLTLPATRESPRVQLVRGGGGGGQQLLLRLRRRLVSRSSGGHGGWVGGEPVYHPLPPHHHRYYYYCVNYCSRRWPVWNGEARPPPQGTLRPRPPQPTVGATPPPHPQWPPPLKRSPRRRGSCPRR